MVGIEWAVVFDAKGRIANQLEAAGTLQASGRSGPRGQPGEAVD